MLLVRRLPGLLFWFNRPCAPLSGAKGFLYLVVIMDTPYRRGDGGRAASLGAIDGER
jgi:hypothetical protein